MADFKYVSIFNDSIDSYLENNKISNHFKKDRLERMRTIYSLEKMPNIDKSFIVDKNHKNGLEIHAVSKEGIIYIYNKRKGNLITAYIAMPYQIRRLYEYCNLIAPDEIIYKSVEHTMQKINTY